MSLKTSNYHEKGTVPEWNILLNISEKLGLEIEWLLTGKGAKHRETNIESPDKPKNLRRLSDKLNQINNSREGILEKFKDRETARDVILTMAEVASKNEDILFLIKASLLGIKAADTDKASLTPTGTDGFNVKKK